MIIVIRVNSHHLELTYNISLCVCFTGVDLHLSFFGRCESMQENFRALHMRFDSDYNKMEFFSSDLAFVPEEVL